jgi:hypothetical protein
MGALPTGQFRPFRLFIQREERWADVVGLSDCVLGKMYAVVDFPSSVAVPTEAPIGSTLELPWRNNISEISRIVAGLYTASTRDDGDKGWRLQLNAVPNRTLVQIHIGNFPADSVGCILLGSGRSPGNRCAVSGSADALKALRQSYGTTPRPIEVLIRDA